MFSLYFNYRVKSVVQGVLRKKGEGVSVSYLVSPRFILETCKETTIIVDPSFLTLSHNVRGKYEITCVLVVIRSKWYSKVKSDFKINGWE